MSRRSTSVTNDSRSLIMRANVHKLPTKSGDTDTFHSMRDYRVEGDTEDIGKWFAGTRSLFNKAKSVMGASARRTAPDQYIIVVRGDINSLQNMESNANKYSPNQIDAQKKKVRAHIAALIDDIAHSAKAASASRAKIEAQIDSDKVTGDAYITAQTVKAERKIQAKEKALLDTISKITQQASKLNQKRESVIQECKNAAGVG